MFRNTGNCHFGDQCRFEHSEGEQLARIIRPRGLCHNWTESGECEYGARCKYFHGDEQGAEAEAEERRVAEATRIANGEPYQTKRRNRTRKKKVSTEEGGEQKQNMEPRAPRVRKKKQPGLCHAFADGAECQYGDECRFRHGENDTRDLLAMRREKAGVCFSLRDNGNCDFGDNCRFSHNLN